MSNSIKLKIISTNQELSNMINYFINNDFITLTDTPFTQVFQNYDEILNNITNFNIKYKNAYDTINKTNITPTNHLSNQLILRNNTINTIKKMNIDNKLRMANINVYYTKKTRFINKMLNYTFILAVIILILLILFKKKILQFIIFIILLILVIIIYGIIIILMYHDLSSRNNLNFDEINFSSPGFSALDSSYVVAQESCLGENCCPSDLSYLTNSIYDSNIGFCVPICKDDTNFSYIDNSCTAIY